MDYKDLLEFCEEWAVEPVQVSDSPVRLGFEARMPWCHVKATLVDGCAWAEIAFDSGRQSITTQYLVELKSACTWQRRQFKLPNPIEVGTRPVRNGYRVKSGVFFPGTSFGILYEADDVARAAFDVLADKVCAHQLIDWLLQREDYQAKQLARALTTQRS